MENDRPGKRSKIRDLYGNAAEGKINHFSIKQGWVVDTYKDPIKIISGSPVMLMGNPGNTC